MDVDAATKLQNLLVEADGWCDTLHVARRHAFWLRSASGIKYSSLFVPDIAYTRTILRQSHFNGQWDGFSPNS